MVQKVTKSKKFEYDNMLEGTFTDLVTAYEYALATNPSLYEALEGIVLLKTPIIQELEEIWLKAYNFESLRFCINGMLLNY